MNPSSPLSPPLTLAERNLAERLHRHVDMLAGLIGPRHMGKPAALAATVAYIEREMGAMGAVVRQLPYDVEGAAAINLEVEKAGGKRAREVVVLGAHYDTIPTTPGADDNASAVAVLIEAMRLLWKSEGARTMRFVAFANEEPPYFFTPAMGSDVYARRCRTQGDQVVGMLCLEMVGYYATAPGSQQTPPGIPRGLRWAFPKRGNFLAAVGNLRSARMLWPFRRGFKRATRFPLFTIALPEIVHEIRLSDNSSFWDVGYPALMLTDTSFLRNPHYHQQSDRVETLDYPRMARVTLGVAGGMGRLAGVREGFDCRNLISKALRCGMVYVYDCDANGTAAD